MKRRSNYIPLAGERLARYRSQRTAIWALRMKAQIAKCLQWLIVSVLSGLASLVMIGWMLCLDGSYIFEIPAPQQAIFWRICGLTVAFAAGGYCGFRAIWALECYVEDCRRIAPRGAIAGGMDRHGLWLKQFIILLGVGLSAPVILVMAMRLLCGFRA